MKSPKTLKDLVIVGHEEVRKAAIAWYIHGVKKNKNPYKMFTDFFDVKEEEVFEWFQWQK